MNLTSHLSTRAARGLKNGGIRTRAELTARCKRCVQELPGIGRRTLGEIECWLTVNGFGFAREDECPCTTGDLVTIHINEDRYAAAIWDAVSRSDTEAYNDLDIQVRYALRNAARRVVGLVLSDLTEDLEEEPYGD